MQGEYLTIEAIREAARTVSGRTGRKALIADKRPWIMYLSDAGKDRLKTLAKNAGVSQADFLEILIRRYGVKAGTDILTALGEPDHGDDDTTSDAGAKSGGAAPLPVR